jgi:hypothetical protein
MDKSKIKQFRLLRKDFCSHVFDDKYWFRTLSIDTLEDNIEHISKVIEYHHEDLDWVNTPTIKEVRDRLEFGSKVHLWMYEDKCYGWHWTNTNCVTIDWKSYHQDIKENEIYIGGALVSRKHKPNRGNSAWYFYRQGFEYSFNLDNTDTMYLYSDDWNRASSILCFKTGFTTYNFLS